MVIIFCYKNHCVVAALVICAPNEIRPKPAEEQVSPMVYGMPLCAWIVLIPYSDGRRVLKPPATTVCKKLRQNDLVSCQGLCVEVGEKYIRPETGWTIWNSFLMNKPMSIGFTPQQMTTCSSAMTSYSWCMWMMVSSQAVTTCSFKMSSKRSKIQTLTLKIKASLQIRQASSSTS